MKLIKECATSPSNRSIFDLDPINLEVRIQITEQKNDFQILLTTYIEDVHSILNSTPPSGVPSDKVIPAAQAAANMLFFDEVDLLIDEKYSNFISRLQIKHDKCIYGPTLPTDAPPTKAANNPIHLATIVLKEKYLYILIPERTVFISGVPDPSASGLIKNPTDVAIRKRAIEEEIQNKKLNIF